MSPAALGGWVLAPVMVLVSVAAVLGLAALAMPRSGATGGERLLAGALGWVVIVDVGVRVLGWAGALTTPVLAGSAFAATALIATAVAVRGVPLPLPRQWPLAIATIPVLVVAAVAVAITVVASYLLPVWQWDALGYHLPYVNFALQRGTLADVPADVPYLSTYPKVVENTFIAWRAMLPDDTMVDLGQLPYGVLGALAISLIARRQGACPAAAVAAGAVWLTLPAVLLQLPTNYVDVAAAALALSAIAFLLGPIDRSRLLFAAVALGLYLGSKPSAPVGVGLLFVALAVVAVRARLGRVIPVAGLLVLILGGESYLRNTVRHGNPIWPVSIDVGPFRLPGDRSVSDLLAAGAAAPRTHGNPLERIAASWSVIWPEVPAFDMRVGGLGILVLIAAPVALVRLVQRCRGADALVMGLVVAATVATPEPAVARFVLPFAGLVLALAIPATELLRDRKQLYLLTFGLIAAGAAQNIAAAYPGFRGEGPPLGEYWDMTDGERRRAVGANGSPAPFLDAVAQLRPGEVALFDRSLELPYLVWRPDLSASAERIPDGASLEEADTLIQSDHVRLLVVGDDMPGGQAARNRPGQFSPIFGCRSSACTVYLRRP